MNKKTDTETTAYKLKLPANVKEKIQKQLNEKENKQSKETYTTNYKLKLPANVKEKIQKQLEETNSNENINSENNAKQNYKNRNKQHNYMYICISGVLVIFTMFLLYFVLFKDGNFYQVNLAPYVEEPITQGVYYTENGNPIILDKMEEYQESTYATNINNILEALNEAPDFLLENLNQVYIKPYEEALSLGQASHGTASANSSTFNITIANRKGWTKSQVKEIITHELGHLYDYAHGRISNSESFQNLYFTNKNKITNYASTKPSEYFAECTMMYVLFPDKLKAKSNEVYNYFNEIYQCY